MGRFLLDSDRPESGAGLFHTIVETVSKQFKQLFTLFANSSNNCLHRVQILETIIQTVWKQCKQLFHLFADSLEHCLNC